MIDVGAKHVAKKLQVKTEVVCVGGGKHILIFKSLNSRQQYVT